MRFDMGDEYDVATYQRLAETGRRAYRSGRGNQSRYLLSLMLGVRAYSGLECMGFIERQEFHPETDEHVAELAARTIARQDRILNVLLGTRDYAPVLRLVPTDNSGSPQESA